MIDVIANVLPGRFTALTAELRGVNGHTGRGRVQYFKWSSGPGRIKIRLNGVAGKAAEIIAGDNDPVALELTDGGVTTKISLTPDQVARAIKAETAVEITQNGETILCGAFRSK